ncbi:hypothetical protein TWF481_007461 [Arthrobotrys musiformis]|uniref:Arsenite methyltransferase n=1 Tax=Arthrobotrys musiformis TaxID=47236 RepID=A0AAV9WBQ6_9PEZI
MDSRTIYQHVQRRYGSVAQAEGPQYSGAIAKAFGYSEEEINSVPRDANLGLSCGNPLAIASLRPGETVVDLGSGAGFDVFLAAKGLGANGHVIGVDINKDMLSRARDNLAKSPEAGNITFIEANITSIPLDNSIADCVISNCVINLVPEADKPAVFIEMARILKPGGRVAISDILARKTLPPSLKEDVTLYTGCIAGAATTEEYKQFLKDAGFSDIMVVDTESDLNIYVNTANLLQGSNENAVGCCRQLLETVDSPTGEKATGKGNVSCFSQVKMERQPCHDAAVSGAALLWESTTDAPSKTNLVSQDLESVDSRFNGTDLNKWVGSFKIFALKP